ncbi:hypothetical protein [Stenoxybacter acetivorans]|uniref:hypothetical protein n=1 Tax=Stenoxybacter acetivorans TaxID=422441 RepID=UPI000561A72C|nr:hypothetical protein [Stenoxybacter acetivorans]
MATIILVEGETEQAFWKVFYQGQTKKINLWDCKEKDINNIALSVKNNDELIIIFDTDVTDNYARFLSNLKSIRQKISGNRVFLLQQNKNFEDELCKACNCKQDKLNQHFNHARSVGKFKSEFIEHFKNKKLREKLEELSIDLGKMWVAELIECLNLEEVKKIKIDGQHKKIKALKR